MEKYPFCPNCGNEETINFIEKEKNIEIKGTPIRVKYSVIHCSNCDIDFKALDKTFDVINEAREKYRKMFNIPSPQEIRKFMDRYYFSLRDMEKLTGIAFKTIDRYLKGGIPDPSNAKLLKIVLNNPETVLYLMKEESHFKGQKFENAKELLEGEIQKRQVNNSPFAQLKETFEFIVSSVYMKAVFHSYNLSFRNIMSSRSIMGSLYNNDKKEFFIKPSEEISFISGDFQYNFLIDTKTIVSEPDEKGYGYDTEEKEEELTNVY